MKRFSTSSDVTRCVRPRRISALTIAALRRANPNLDDEQGPRALLLPPSANTAAALERHLDEAADALASEFDNRPAQVAHPELLARESDAPVPASMLQLYALDDSSAMLSAALRAGFFCFGSEFHMPGRPIEERGLLNLELAGPAIEPCGDEIGGRLVLDLTPGSGQSLVVGKRSIKTVASATSTPSAAAPSSSGGFQYRLTVNRAFDRSWATIVASHGVDWLGFSRIREAYHRLHTQQPAPWDARSAASASVASAASAVSAAVTTAACDTPRVLSIELWALKGPLARSKPSAPDGTRQVSPELWDPAAVATSAVLVSAEVGVLVGTCYTCLSLHADTAAYPRSDHVRAQAAVMLLRRAGVTLVDVGTTAEYYRVLFGFRRVPVDEDSLEGGGDSSSSEPPPMDTWAKPEECQAWAGSGQCKENPGFMLVNCAFSCAKLTYARARYEKRCPKPEGHVAALAPGLMNATFSRVMSDFPELEPELLSEDPPVVLFHKFFRPSETDAFVRHGKGRYSKSLGVGMKADGTMGDVKTEIRTSSHGWCQHHECLQDPEVRRVIKRVADVTLTPENNAEYAQLVYYHACNSATDNNCAFYRQHNDFIDSDEFKLQGPRIYTLFGYMNDVPEGGGTRFTSLPSGPLTIQPQRGKAILWPSVLAMEPFSKDSRTDHEALPVTSGEKFGANFWIHQHDFKTPHTSGCTHEK